MKKRKNILKKLFASVLVVALTGTMLSLTAEAAEEKQETSVIAQFDFNNDTDGFTGSGAKAAGKYELRDSYEGAGKALYLDGTAGNFLKITDLEGNSLLTGLDEMTISCELKRDRTDTNWWIYAAPNDNGQSYPNEHYVGVMQKGANVTVERYHNNGRRPEVPVVSSDSDWAHIDVVFRQSDTVVYVDGIEEARVSSDYRLGDILGENSVLYIGKANWGSGEYCKGYMDNLTIYGKALSKEEIQRVPVDAYKSFVLKKAVSFVEGVKIEASKITLPDYDGTVTWKSGMPEITIGEDGITATVKQPETDADAIEGTITAVITRYGKTEEKEVAVTIRPMVGEDEPYGYLMVHFIQDENNYKEKIYLDISRGDNPEQWDPLNDGEPVLASSVGTTGVRDPYLTYNPETETYYIIATDLRVWGGDNRGWDAWQRTYSTKMNVWESKDLITWSDMRQFDVALDKEGNKVAELGMLWAPEATWVPDYYGEGKGAFVTYWSSKIYNDAEHTGNTYPRIMWGATTDFTQETYEYGGVFIEAGRDTVDTTIIQNEGRTYHITKRENVYMEYTDDKEWWLPSAKWVTVQENIGGDRYNPLEGPAVFKDHSKENRFYLFVDDYSEYKPMVTSDLNKGWEHLDSSDYYLKPRTKHGGVISLTKAQYDAIRNADAVSAVSKEQGTVEVSKGAAQEELEAALPKTVEVNLAYQMGTAKLPVKWTLSAVDTQTEGEYTVTGIVQSIGANKNHWVGKNGSERFDAEEKQLYSTKEIQVSVVVSVKEEKLPVPPAKLPYVDVKENDWFYDGVYYNYFAETMTGKDETHFAPLENLARAQFAVIIHRMQGEPEMKYTAKFPDVEDEIWYTDAILWAADKKIVNGYSDTGLFGPADNINREQMAVMMYRYAESMGYDVTEKADIGKFEDAASVNAFAEDAMKWAVANGIINGKYEGTKIDPQGNALRGECALIIQRFMEKYEK